MDNFNLKKYLVENKLTVNSRLYENLVKQPSHQMRQDKAADAADDALLEKWENLIDLVEVKLKTPLYEVSIEALKQQFVDTEKITPEDFEEIINAVGTKSAYATWLAKKVADGIIKGEDIYKYKEYFSIFDRQKRKYPKQDINQYKTEQDLESFVDTTLELKGEEEKDPSQQKGISKTDKYRKYYIGSVDGFDVYKLPKDATELYGVSCELGSGTQWCTATGKTRSYFESYIKRGPLYIFIKPGTNEKYQFSYEANQFMNKNDRTVL